MNRKFEHMGIAMTDKEHEKWHREHGDSAMTEEQHKAMMRNMGISPEKIVSGT
ncbi:MAG TPA: hypothetical protein VK436_15055 [Methanocella sp.]|nr:hypothetical protein [Methanocella sp.]